MGCPARARPGGHAGQPPAQSWGAGRATGLGRVLRWAPGLRRAVRHPGAAATARGSLGEQPELARSLAGLSRGLLHLCVVASSPDRRSTGCPVGAVWHVLSSGLLLGEGWGSAPSWEAPSGEPGPLEGRAPPHGVGQDWGSWPLRGQCLWRAGGQTRGHWCHTAEWGRLAVSPL